MIKPSQLIVRSWTQQDIPYCAVIAAKASGVFAWKESAYQSSFDHGHTGLLLCHESQVLACLVGQTVFDVAELFDIQVLPEWQGRGCGRCLLQAYVEACKADHVDRILLEVRSENDQALGFYERQGFMKIGKRLGYYSAQGTVPADDAFVLEKKVL